MKTRYLLAASILATVLCGCATTSQKVQTPKSPLEEADSIVWVGLDYSMVQMIGTQDFREPERIFPGMLDAWNYLFLYEGWTERAGEALRKQIFPDTSGIDARNRLATTDQVIRKDHDASILIQPHITASDISDAVRSYQLKDQDGTGLVFVVDRLVKLPQKGSIHVVFFDIGTREVIQTSYGVYPAQGFGFRNYWFGVIKAAVPELKQFR